MLTDTARVLENLLLIRGLVDEVSLLVHLVIVGRKSYSIFGDIDTRITLKLHRQETLEEKYLLLVYKTTPTYPRAKNKASAHTPNAFPRRI